MAAVRKLPSGKYRVRWRDAHGNEHGETFTRHKAALNFKRDVEAKQLHGTFIDPKLGQETLETFWRKWYRRAEQNDRPGERTRVAYEELWRLYIGPKLGAQPLAAITRQDVSDLVNAAATRSAWRAQDVLKVTRMLLNKAMDDELIGRNPAARVTVGAVATPAEIRVLEPNDLDAVVAQLPERFKAFALVASYCSLRWSEAIALRADDLDLDAMKVRVDEACVETAGKFIWGPPKTRDSARTVDLPLTVLRSLREHLDAFPPDGASGLVFTGVRGGPIRRHVFRQAWSKACAAARVDPTRPGWMRHTGASMAYAATRDLKATAQRLGHTSVRMVDGTYVKLYEERGREVADAIDTLVGAYRARPVARTWHEAAGDDSS